MSAPRLDRIHAEKTRVLFRNCPAGVVFATIVAILLAATMRGASPLFTPIAYLWSGTVGGCAAAHLLLCVVYWRAAPADADWRRWNLLFTLIALAEGIVWCLGTFWLIADGNELQEMTVLLTWSGVVTGGLLVFGAYTRTYLVFAYPAMFPHIWLFFSHAYPYGATILFLLFIYMIAIPLLVTLFNAQLNEGLRLRFENLDLAEDMRLQKERADQANAAKSSFLAAASHDLRQPIHALGLFIGALRGRKMDRESRRLVDHIDRSVGAMDDLFASMLDISKLDAGVVRAHLEAVAIAPLLERVCRDQSEEAADKALTLRFVASSAVVTSDPLLLERILRNLISNGVRYTDAGRVLVGCRRRAGVLAIEIWDTGRGISTSDQLKVFEEFYQVGNPERDRTQGLGLGLAIVKRIAPLIGAALTFESSPGKGSVFRLAVPLYGGELPTVERVPLPVSRRRVSRMPHTMKSPGAPITTENKKKFGQPID